jgi:hypothetical protein
MNIPANLYRRTFLILTASSLLLAGLTGCGTEELTDEEINLEETAAAESSPEEAVFAGETPRLGTAYRMEGTTALVSIFASDADFQWQPDSSQEDNQLIWNSLKYLGIAAQFLQDTCTEYGRSSTFLYDWNANKDLFYTADWTDQSVAASEDLNETVDAFIESSIDTEAIRQNHGADNLLYIVYFNTPKDCTEGSYGFAVLPHTIDFYAGANEFAAIYVQHHGFETDPAIYAHEILHCFGAADLYETAMMDIYGINADVRAAYAQIHPDDIMNNTYDPATGMPLYDHVPARVTELTAYYVGLTDHSDFKDQYQLQDNLFVTEG